MNSEDISSNLFKLVEDPTKVAIWQEVLNNKGITAKEISKNLYLKGTNIYYHLNYLEEKELIISKTHQIPNSNLLEKTYEINSVLYSDEEIYSRKELRYSSKAMKEVIQFRLLRNVSFFQQQRRRIIEMSDEEVDIFLEKDANFIPKISFVQKKDLPQIVKKIEELLELIDKSRKNKEPLEYSKKTTHGILLGCLPMRD